MSPDTNHCLIDNHLTRRTRLTIPSTPENKTSCGLMMISVSCSHTAGDPCDNVTWTLGRPGGGGSIQIHEDTYSWIQCAWLAAVSPAPSSCRRAFQSLPGGTWIKNKETKNKDGAGIKILFIDCLKILLWFYWITLTWKESWGKNMAVTCILN